jgi:hypothetical protein
VAIEDLIRRFTAYRLSHSKLLVEIARRRQYKEAAENIVRSMVAQLEAMSDGMFRYSIALYAYLSRTMSQKSDWFANLSMRNTARICPLIFVFTLRTHPQDGR